MRVVRNAPRVVEFGSAEDLEYAVRKLDGSKLDGHIIEVFRETELNTSYSLGGGGGGSGGGRGGGSDRRGDEHRRSDERPSYDRRDEGPGFYRRDPPGLDRRDAHGYCRRNDRRDDGPCHDRRYDRGYGGPPQFEDRAPPPPVTRGGGGRDYDRRSRGRD